MSRAIALLLVMLATLARAQPSDDVAVGERLTTQGGGGAIPPCASCHGARGEGQPASDFPRLAALPAEYVLHQLASYADGTRKHPVMAPIASAMSPEQRRAAAIYYAQLVAPPTTHARAKGALDRGRILAVRGDESRQVQACANCHGPGGRGLPPGYPYLAGQDPEYAAAQLAAFASGERATDGSGIMPLIGKRLAPADVAAVVAYFASRPPPRPVPVTIRALPDQTSAAASPGVTPSTAQPGPVGANQSQATQGGTQGAGGAPATSDVQGTHPGTNPSAKPTQ